MAENSSEDSSAEAGPEASDSASDQGETKPAAEEAVEDTPAILESPEAAEPDDDQVAAGEDAVPSDDPETGEPAEAGLGELTLGEGAPAGESSEPKTSPLIRGKIDRFGIAMGTGRRKTSVARVRIKEGSGDLVINGRALEEYFPVERDRLNIQAPLRATETLGKVDVWVSVQGGGTTGQSGAIVLGIARALQAMNADLHTQLSEGGYLTRDGRMVERKKYGFKKARKSFQFSKR
jgi:small subunit ribosomal protein S9